MLKPFPVTFRAVHVISDLHLGGSKGFQIFAESNALSSYILGLIEVDGPPRCLVINGDFVDFLAEAPQRHFDPLGAVAKLERIVADPTFNGVFKALREYLEQPNAWLAIVLGNHDVELALPWVRESLVHTLCDGEAERRGRCLLSLQGEGLLLQVAGEGGPVATVMCVHGNEVDGWNVVEHETVRRLGRDAWRDQRIDESWIPNAGSRLVIEVMNELKGTFAFVDLLKPETEAVLPILFSLRPQALAKLNTIAGAAARRTFDSARIRGGWLGEEAGVEAGTAAPSQNRLRSMQPARPALSRQMAEELLNRTEERLAREEDPLDLVDADQRRDYLGYFGAGWALLKRDPVEALRQSLEKLDKDRSFLFFHEDDTYRDLHERVSTNVDFLVAGHTHLARAIEREAGRSWYFNSGTWARVFRIPDAVRQDKARFATLYDRLRTRDVTQLDKLHQGDKPLLERVPPHVVVVRAAQGEQSQPVVHGELLAVNGATPGATTLVHRFTRS